MSSPPDADLVAAARTVLLDGGSDDDAARAVLMRTRSPIAAIKAMRAARPGLTLADAKPLIHRNLPQDTRESAEFLWDEVERAIKADRPHMPLSARKRPTMPLTGVPLRVGATATRCSPSGVVVDRTCPRSGNR